MKNFYFYPLSYLLLATTASLAAAPIHLQQVAFSTLKQKFQLSLPGLTQVSKATDNLQFVKQHTDGANVSHIRLQQQYKGLPVIGGYAIIHSKYTAQQLLQTNTPVSMDGIVYDNLSQELGAPPPNLLNNAQIALQTFKKNYAHHLVSEEQVTPVVYIDRNKKAHWAYRVSMLLTFTDRIPERPAAIIDATSYQPYVQWNDMKTVRSAAKGMGFGGNQKIGAYLFGKHYPLLDITRTNTTGMCYMENRHVKIVDMQHQYSFPNKAMHFVCRHALPNDPHVFWTGYNGDGYDLNNGAYAPSNDALYIGQIMKQMYHDWYGVEVLTNEKGNAMQLIMRIHYGEGYENAYWDGKQMTFGDGGATMYPLVSLGIGGHEISHGFTEQHSNLEYYEQSGGINEAFSDMAAQSAEYYVTGKNNWQIGGEIMKNTSTTEALRYMDRPSRDGMSIDTAAEYYTGLDVHFSSGVYNHLFYLLANKPNWNTRKAFDVMVKANMDYWTPYSTFKEASCGVLHATQDLGLPLEDVKNALSEVAISYNLCRL